MILSRYEEIHSYEVQPQIHINLYTGTTINKAFNKAFTTKSGLFSGYRIEFKRFHTKVQCVWINLTQKNNLEICANHYHIKAHNFHMENGSILMLLLLCVDFFWDFHHHFMMKDYYYCCVLCLLRSLFSIIIKHNWSIFFSRQCFLEIVFTEGVKLALPMMQSTQLISMHVNEFVSCQCLFKVWNNL